MKKLLIGCLVVAILGVVALAVGGFLAWRMAQPYVEDAGQYVAGFKRLGELAEIGRLVENTAPYAPVASGELTGAQVDRFVRVQTRVRDALGARFADLDARYQQLDRGRDGGQRSLSFAEAGAALSDLSSLVVDARRVQVEAINTERFSQAEYDWVRASVYAAAGIEAAGFSLEDIQRVAEQGAAGQAIAGPATPPAEVPARNRELVRPHVQQLTEWIPLAFFGF